MANAAHIDRMRERDRREKRRKSMHAEKLDRLERLLAKRQRAEESYVDQQLVELMREIV